VEFAGGCQCEGAAGVGNAIHRARVDCAVEHAEEVRLPERDLERIHEEHHLVAKLSRHEAGIGSCACGVIHG
jgi:hypothetical protein